MTFSFHCIPVGIDNCFLLRGERTIFVDGGAPGGLPAFRRGLAKLGVEPREISLILLTHGHWDHIACLHPIQELTGAPVAAHYQDQAWVETGRPAFPRGVTTYGKGMIWMAERLIHPQLPPVKVDRVLGDEGFPLAEFGIPGQVVYTPGHSMGSISILLDSGEALVGDLAMNDWYLRLTPGLPVLADDIGLVIESWKRLLPMGVKNVYPAHGKPFSVKVIEEALQRD
ncbi:MAG: MBL fold metallo-hydrolase [Anaerolineales bacterium]|nr:MBL fold metallo-hydrolase [Anaerolineales bacterium]